MFKTIISTLAISTLALFPAGLATNLAGGLDGHNDSSYTISAFGPRPNDCRALTGPNLSGTIPNGPNWTGVTVCKPCANIHGVYVCMNKVDPGTVPLGRKELS
ncbi:hypothetical protein SAMN04489737_0662 [Arcanobacterium phocae]|uniref:Uncharacterized protein n=1 Tax=Arcanobacterium phocae TaxID=131112 RepID=A0A1H2LE88_9ACTO|nr:hypothetical protein SAMN04489737_0662 [Arcanobacterium phocae]